MFVLENENTTLPLKVWLEDESRLEPGCLEQAYHLSALPFLYKWVALMPDTHQGMGMPIGGVIAADNAVVPNAVGVDIGCGMCFVETNLPVSLLKGVITDSGNLIQGMIGDIMRAVPAGFSHHRRVQPCWTLDRARQELELYESHPQLCGQFEAGYYQVGTLGGGNHFIELQEDEKGMLGVMIHSGSRNFGKQICDYFHNIAREWNEQWGGTVPDWWRLAHLPADSPQGRDYITWMNLAMEFAMENRAKMMLAVQAILEKWVGRHTDLSIECGEQINCHHNYAASETHYGKQVWVHRKGAIRAGKGELAVIPGAMGSYSYVVEGLGNPESFHTSSHGAGRRYSRKAAMKAFAADEVLEDLRSAGVVLGKRSSRDVAEESRFAYKDINEVMAQQGDLVRPVKKLRTVGVVKG